MGLPFLETGARQKTAAERHDPTTNHCPYGCGVEEIDHVGHCRHYVGCARAGSNAMEPRKQRYHVRTDLETDKKYKVPSGAYYLDGKDPQPVPKKAVRVTIQGYDRIYTEDGMPEYVPPREDIQQAATAARDKSKD